MLGAIVGDIIGSIYEANPIKSKQFPLISEISRITDDSILTIAVADTLLAYGRTRSVKAYSAGLRKWATRYPYAGYGGNFIQWMNDKSLGPYNSWGNGSAMRVSAVGWASESIEEVLKIAEATALPTHNHEEGIRGAKAVALAVYMARTGATKDEIRRSVSDIILYDLSRSLDEIRPSYQFEISCQKSVPEAITAFLDSDSFEDAIRNAVSLGGDSDTQAAIAGSIAEAFYGGIPKKFMAMILPRLPEELLDISLGFSKAFLDNNVTSAITAEKSLRTGLEPAGMQPYRSRYSVVLHSDTKQKIEDYTRDIKNGNVEPGAYLQREIDGFFSNIINAEAIYMLLLRTKRPRIFAESEVIGDGSDWNERELSILGDISIAIPVRIFDDGRHTDPEVYDEPFSGMLLYVPGALLASSSGAAPADWNEVTIGGEIDQEAFDRLYLRRLLPVFKYASADAIRFGHQVLLTLPGLGCGQFAGPFRGRLQEHLKKSIEKILSDYHEELPGIKMVWYDPYQNCSKSTGTFGHIEYRVRPLADNGLPQLRPATDYEEKDDDFSNCRLYSIVAWDHVSLPGNDFYAGCRMTDDGVKAAATDTMFRITGIRGHYDKQRNMYIPSQEYRNWEEVLQENDIPIQTFEKPIIVDGAFSKSDQEVEQL